MKIDDTDNTPAKGEYFKQAHVRFSVTEVIAFLGVIALVECFLSFRNINHFFDADTVHWLYHRATSWKDFLEGFLTRDVSTWYRPLGNRLLPFVFYRWFGLVPAGYRIVIAVLCLISAASVFMLLARLTRSRIAAYAGAFYFAIHTVNAAIAYDADYAPEIMLAIFCIGSVMLFMLYRQKKRRIYLLASCLGFICALWSKESAVTLPFILVVASVLILSNGSLRKRIVESVFAAKWHFLILAAYLIFTIGYLHVGCVSLQSILTKPPAAQGPSYYLVADQSMLRNLSNALSWAFNIPRGYIASWMGMSHGQVQFLKMFRFAIGILALIFMFTFRRRWILLGVCWFVIALIPALLLRDHFLCYYIYLPLFGIALIIGVEIDGVYQRLKGFSNKWKLGGLCLLAGIAIPLLIICRAGIHNAQRDGSLLGVCSRRAKDCLDDLSRIVRNPKTNSVIYIINDAFPNLFSDTAEGGLYKLFYDEKGLRIFFSSKHVSFPLDENADLFVLKYDNGHLRDVTNTYKYDTRYSSHLVGEWADGTYPVYLSSADLVGGKDSLIMRIPNFSGIKVQVFFTLNGGPVESFDAQLDSQGQIRFELPVEVRKGAYRFFAFKTEQDPAFYKTEATMNIH
jgi:hypothetical protein